MARRHRLSLERRQRLLELRALGYSWAKIKRGNPDHTLPLDAYADEDAEPIDPLHEWAPYRNISIARLKQAAQDTLAELAITSNPELLRIERQRVLMTLDAITQEAWRLHRGVEDARTLRVVLDTIKERIALLGLRLPQPDEADDELRQLGLVWLPIKEQPDDPGLVPHIVIDRSKTNGTVPT